jgi:hypothetical protein
MAGDLAGQAPPLHFSHRNEIDGALVLFHEVCRTCFICFICISVLARATNREIFQGRLLLPKWSLDSALCSFYSHGLQEKRNIEGLFAVVIDVMVC